MTIVTEQRYFTFEPGC